MERLYDVRSAVEHLHDPLRVLDAPDGRSRILLLAHCAHQAEAIARHCVSRVLAKKALWSHFSDDAAIHDFWKLGLAEQKAHWGEALDFATVSGQFAEDMAAMELRI
jgi:hypothetical protein